MRKFWLFVLVALALSGCAAQEASSPKQAKAEGDFDDCARTEGVRGATITNIVDTPSGVSFKFKIDGGGSVALSQMDLLSRCMRAKGYRVGGFR